MSQQDSQIREIITADGVFPADELARIIAHDSKRGEWYDGPDSTHVQEWLAEGDIDPTMTNEQLIAMWDAE